MHYRHIEKIETMVIDQINALEAIARDAKNPTAILQAIEHLRATIPALLDAQSYVLVAMEAEKQYNQEGIDK